MGRELRESIALREGIHGAVAAEVGERSRAAPAAGDGARGGVSTQSRMIPKLARQGRLDYLLLESPGISEPLPVVEPRLGRRTVLTFPLLPPPQKN